MKDMINQMSRRVGMCLFLAATVTCYALDEQQSYLEVIASGDVRQLRKVCQKIHKAGEQDTQVLDPLAARLVQNCRRVRGSTSVDAYAWACRVLGKSGNPRYYDALSTVDTPGVNPKLRSFARQAMLAVGCGDVPQVATGRPGAPRLDISDPSAPRVITPADAEAASPLDSLSPLRRQYVNQILCGDAAGLRAASQAMQRSRESHQLVLDLLAEALLRQLPTPSTPSHIDACAWACKALAASGNPRYRNVLDTIVATPRVNPKLRKYATQSRRALRANPRVAPYQRGDLNIGSLREQVGAQAPAPFGDPVVVDSPPPGAATTPTGDFSKIREGMTQQEVYAILGVPTSTGSHITGKSFSPFYYGGDGARLIARYKGMGEISFNRKGAYGRTWYVLTITSNPAETGYR